MSRITCNQGNNPVVEDIRSGGFLKLRSSDGFNTFSPNLMVDNCIVGFTPAHSSFRIVDGQGDATAAL